MSRRRCCLFPLSKRQTDATALGTFSKRFFVVVKEEDILMKPTTAFLVPIFWLAWEIYSINDNDCCFNRLVNCRSWRRKTFRLKFNALGLSMNRLLVRLNQFFLKKCMIQISSRTEQFEWPFSLGQLGCC